MMRAAARFARHARYQAAGTRSMSTAAPATAAEELAASAYRRFGHFEAQIDPLGMRARPSRPEIAIATGGADPALVAHLREAYMGHIGAEFEHLDSAEERAWWAENLERLVPASSPHAFALTHAQKRNFNVLLQQAEQFELFLAKKYVSFKRYSGEGAEAMLPALDAMFATAAAGGVDDCVVGMAHRGRLALQVSLMNYPARKMFWKISGNNDLPDSVQGLDDVSSHITVSTDRVYGVGDSARKIHVTLLPNPSHLEAVNPVAVGKTRAKMDQGSRDPMCLLIHGDSAVSGQGVVAETYAMSQLSGYSVGGTVHLITNNQVGFTSDERSARSSPYASDMAKIVGAPVLHVNAESLRDVVLASRLAVEYRQRFRKDVVVDLIGYRRHGHNELDAPEFTQPIMYKEIRSRTSFATAYANQLESEGVLSAAARASLMTKLNAHLEAEFEAAKAFTSATGSTGSATGDAGKHVVADGSAFAGKWAHIRQSRPDELFTSPDTGYDVSRLRELGAASVRVPSDVKVHDRLVRSHIQARLAALGVGADATSMLPSFDPASATVDWATAEALAFGSLLAEGHPVRLTGQDSQRGTFSHRHAALTCQTSGNRVVPLNSAIPDQKAKLTVVSSFLSEFAVMGFEFGYSWESPSPLVLWEAQFGDFANGAQIIIDQFLSGSESKWLRQSGLVLLLPHGFDGAGPEHSSARIERFLQLVNAQALAREAPTLFQNKADKTLHESTNMIVANPTTPANYFHLLRRQIARPYRKPLVVIAPKTLLRHPQALSSLQAMAPGTSFQPVLGDALAAPDAASKATRVVLVSGKFYFELAKRRADTGANHVGLVRVEELAPFPTEAIVRHVKSTYPAAREIIWCQEEPANAGAWQFAEAHLHGALAKAGLPSLEYIGRPALAAPAVGLSKLNKVQQDHILASCI